MAQNVLITGGTGFIGSYVADEPIQRGYRVRALDNLSVQVHGPGKKRPAYLHPEGELVVGEVRDPEAVRRRAPPEKPPADPLYLHQQSLRVVAGNSSGQERHPCGAGRVRDALADLCRRRPGIFLAKKKTVLAVREPSQASKANSY